MQNQVGGTDSIGHSSIQPWSAGPLFPGVIARIGDRGHEALYKGQRAVFLVYRDNGTPGGYSDVSATYDGARAYIETILSSKSGNRR